MEYVESIPREIYRAFEEKNIALFYYGQTDSTNKRAREYCLSAEDEPRTPSLFVADGQTEGRGRCGRSFFSPASTGLYMTLLIRAPESSATFTRVTALTAVACVEAIEAVFGLRPAIKWVNDLYVGGKKIAGILAESFTRDGARYIALGIGVNIATEDFPEELRSKAGSLGAMGEIDEIKARSLALAFWISVNFFGAIGGDEEEYMAKYRRYSCVIGKRIRFGDKQGRVLDITDMGELFVETDDGERVLLSTGEISILPLDGQWK